MFLLFCKDAFGPQIYSGLLRRKKLPDFHSVNYWSKGKWLHCNIPTGCLRIPQKTVTLDELFTVVVCEAETAAVLHTLHVSYRPSALGGFSLPPKLHGPSFGPPLRPGRPSSMTASATIVACWAAITKYYRYFFLTVLEGGTSKARVPADSVSGEGSSWLAEGCLLALASHGRER